ncbi:hypothetical protein B0J13DRAFT_156933 [Dactylonectria estremocensis]|uniref:DUF221-domain-containing protein n=1 Tax=Dactylonectria estremocensis TaxID=1079267 RepID=A0A9P9DNE7_9HYPO|nr:hypothetical protein B0J13DRAFT_156933 [Dactylonectria estremocensis]
MDGYFFLRYLKVLRNIFFVGICISWPILFPIHITGGNNLKQLEQLTIGNINNPKLLFAHVAVAWVFFGFVLFTISRECIYYINIRQAYLSSPHYAQRLSSRTILLTSVPNTYLDEARLRKLYGDSVKRVWIPRTSKALVKLVKEREQTAIRLEKAEIELIKKANAARRKKLRKSPPATTSSVVQVCEPAAPTAPPSPTSFITAPDIDQPLDVEPLPEVEHKPGLTRRVEAGPELGLSVTELSLNPNTFQDPLEKLEDPDYIHPYGLDPDLPDVRGSVAAQWISVTERPHHRPLANYGRRVDTIRWCRTRLKDLNVEIAKLRRQLRRGDGRTLPAAFVEFDTQESAQAAHQVVTHHRPMQMAPRILGIRPDEVVWSALRMRWWERVIRRFLIMGLITVAIIFWSIPSALIGIVSNVSFLATNVFFLKWLLMLPKPILGFLQGFVPAMALSFWMSLVPAMLRACAEVAGVPSFVLIELFVQNAYFVFQVVQVFLITTLTSAASAAFMKILENPVSAKDLLAENLPKASNFYLSYILVQCLVVGSTNMLHLFELVRQFIFSKIAQVPRSRFNVWYKLRPPRWGGIFPVFSNMAVIALSYTCIAPLVLAFACMGMTFVGLIYRYNILYVFDSELDTKGLFYPRALLHIITGLYMAEICLIGLFALNSGFGPMVMMLMFFVFTGLVHITLMDAMTPLLQNLPQTLTLEEQIQEEEELAAERRKQAEAEAGTGGAANDYYDTELGFGEDEFDTLSYNGEDDDGPPPTDRAVEGASSMRTSIADWLKSSAKSKLKAQAEESGFIRVLNKLGLAGSEDGSDSPPGFLKRWMHPEIYEDYLALRKLIPDCNLPDTEYPEDHTLSSYWPPSYGSRGRCCGFQGTRRELVDRRWLTRRSLRPLRITARHWTRRDLSWLMWKQRRSRDTGWCIKRPTNACWNRSAMIPSFA